MTEHDYELAIQCCVDGELSEADQQKLLASLEQSGDGWRRLALGFIEHQIWRDGCQGFIAFPIDSASTNSKVTASEITARRGLEASPQTRTSVKSFRWTAVAGLLVALGVGYGAGQLSGRRPSEGPILAETPQDPPTRKQAVSSREATEFPSTPIHRNRTPVMTVSSQPRSPLTLDLPLSDDGEKVESVQIPVYQPSALTGPNRPGVKNILTGEQERELEDQGYRVNRRRQVIAVPLENGDRVLVPVDTYGLQYGIQ